MAVSSISNVTALQNNSINLVVIFTTSDRPANYGSIYLQCYDPNGNYVGVSGNLNYSYSGSAPHWSGNWNFTGLTAGTTYTFKCIINGGEQYGIQRNFTTTGTAPPPTPSTPSIAKVSENGLSITLRAYISSNTEYVDWDARYDSGAYERVYTFGTYTDKTFTVPSYGTTYSWDVIAYNAYGSSSWSSLYSWTPVPPPKPTDRIRMDFFSATDSSFTMRILDTYGATGITWDIRKLDGTIVHQNSRPTSGVPFYESFGSSHGIESGTEYVVRASGYNVNGSVEARLSSVLTHPKTAGLSSGGTVDNTVKVNVTPYGGFDTIEVEMWTIDATSRINFRTQSWNGGVPFYVEFTSLVPNASYLFRTRTNKTSSFGYQPSPSDWSGWLTIKNEVTRPANWKWTTAQNTDGFKIQGATFSMLAGEWNLFTARINLFRKFKGDATYPQKTFTQASSGGDFMFYMFNEAVVAINDMKPSGVSQKTKGSSIVASDFNNLMNTLNSL